MRTRYYFSAATGFIVGEKLTSKFSASPAKAVAVDRITINAPTADFFKLISLKCNGVELLIAPPRDAIIYSANTKHNYCDMVTPIVIPGGKLLEVEMEYTGLVTPPFYKGFKYTACVAARGFEVLTSLSKTLPEKMLKRRCINTR